MAPSHVRLLLFTNTAGCLCVCVAPTSPLSFDQSIRRGRLVVLRIWSAWHRPQRRVFRILEHSLVSFVNCCCLVSSAVTGVLQPRPLSSFLRGHPRCPKDGARSASPALALQTGVISSLEMSLPLPASLRVLSEESPPKHAAHTTSSSGTRPEPALLSHRVAKTLNPLENFAHSTPRDVPLTVRAPTGDPPLPVSAA